MYPPIRCISCNKVLGELWNEYVYRVTIKNEAQECVLTDMGIHRMCCRRVMLSVIVHTSEHKHI